MEKKYTALQGMSDTNLRNIRSAKPGVDMAVDIFIY